MRKFFIAVAIVIALVVGTVLVGPSFVNWNAYRGDVAAQLKAATGRDIAIDGELSLAMLPSPRLLATGLRLTGPDGAEFEDLLRLRTVEVHVALAPLIERRVQVSSVVLIEPEFVVERLADGRINWIEAFAAAPDGGASSFAVQFDNVRIERGTVIYTDAASGARERLEDLDATITASSLRGPVRTRGSATLRATPIDFEIGMGEWAVDRGVPVNAAVSLSDGTGKIDVSGIVTGLGSEPRVTGTVATESENLFAALAAIMPSAPSPYLAQRFSLRGTLSGSAEAVALSEIALELGETRADGRLSVRLDSVPHADASFNIGRVNVDAILAVGQAREDAEPSDSPSSEFALPAGMSARFDVSADAVVINAGIVRQAQLAGDLSDGKLTLSQVNALLPGGSDVTVFGVVTAVDGKPEFDGQMEANSDNFRGLLEWFDVDVTDVPLGRLRKLEAHAQVKATPTGLTVSEIDILADVSHIRGGVAVALRERPGFGIGISVDKLDIGAYLPKTGSDPADPAATQMGLRERLQLLAILDRFDAILQLEAGSLTYGDVSVRGLQFDGTLQGGSLELRAASVANLAGSEIALAGAISDFTGEPELGLDVEIESDDASALLALAGVTTELPLRNASLAARLDGGFPAMRVDSTLRAMAGEFGMRGTLTTLDRDMGYDVEVTARHSDAVELANLLGADLQGDLGGLDLTATLTGAATATTSNLTMVIGDGALSARTQWTQGNTGPFVDVDLVASYPDFGQLLQVAAPAYRPALAAPGPFRLEARIEYTPDGLTARDLTSELGPVRIEGDIELSLGAARPRLATDLAVSEIIVDWFLPLPAAGDPAPPNRTQRPWSRDPLDWSLLSWADAELSLTAPSISYGAYRIDEPTVELRLDDGVLQLRELSGRAFDGTVSMNARVEAADLPAARLELSVEDADAPQLAEAAQTDRAGQDTLLDTMLRLLFPVQDLRLASGRINAELTAAASGRNEFGLASSLDGDAEITLVEAIVDGADLCAVSERLGELDKVEGLINLVAGAGTGGRTEFEDFTAAFTISGGVAELQRENINADCATAEVWGSLDLPRWTLDMWTHASLIEHPEFPGIRIHQTGDIDAAETSVTNLDDIQQFLAARAVDSVLQQVAPEVPALEQVLPEIAPLLPAPNRPPAPEPAPVAEPPAPADRFRDVLDNLMRP